MENLEKISKEIEGASKLYFSLRADIKDVISFGLPIFWILQKSTDVIHLAAESHVDRLFLILLAICVGLMCIGTRKSSECG